MKRRKKKIFLNIFYLFRKTKTITKTKTISNDPVGDAYAVRAQEEQRLIQMKVCSHT
jgi:hypothetical protein